MLRGEHAAVWGPPVHGAGGCKVVYHVSVPMSLIEIDATNAYLAPDEETAYILLCHRRKVNAKESVLICCFRTISRSGRQLIKGYLIILFILMRRIIIASTDDIHEEQGAEDLEGIDYIRTALGR
jgi:hypothetical protein